MIQSEIAGEKALQRRLNEPNLSAARVGARLLLRCFLSLGGEAELGVGVARAVAERALVRSSNVFSALRTGDPRLTALVLVDRWTSSCAEELRKRQTVDPAARSWLDGLRHQLSHERLFDPAAIKGLFDPRASTWNEYFEASDVSVTEPPGDTEWYLLYNQAIEQVVTQEFGVDPVRTALRGLLARLELSQDQVGRMLSVSGETIRRWEMGAVGIPVERQAAILAAEAQLRRLQDLFRPERLSTAIRRPADLFDGESALDWILRGRIAEVADRYEAALLYQA